MYARIDACIVKPAQIKADTGSCYSEQDVLHYFDVQRDGLHHLPHTEAHSHLQCARCL